MKILLVDDEPFVLRLVMHQLKELGFTDVVAHQHPRAALALLESDVACADTVLLDLQMPDIDGVEFVRHLGRLAFQGSLVLLSGEDERILQTAQKLALGHRLDVAGAFRKPVTPDQLRSVLGSPHPTGARPRMTARIYSSERLRTALAQHELVNWYQPKVDLRTGRVVGVETLVRWQHPVDGIVFPDQFIPLAEEAGLIDGLTAVVMQGALRQARSWLDEHLDLHVAVNVSMDNLARLDFPDDIARSAESSGVPARLLVLEITESRLMKNPLVALDILTRLRLKHIGLSIDDFGTGHSSLTQLRDIPFDELKIDRSFVHGAHASASNHALVLGSIHIARQLGLRTVAEGVEDRADWDHLRSLGCDLAQGYFIAKPMPGAAVSGWLREWELRRPSLVAA